MSLSDRGPTRTLAPWSLPYLCIVQLAVVDKLVDGEERKKEEKEQEKQ